jgi:hypothetical protein
MIIDNPELALNFKKSVSNCGSKLLSPYATYLSSSVSLILLVVVSAESTWFRKPYADSILTSFLVMHRNMIPSLRIVWMQYLIRSLL